MTDICEKFEIIIREQTDGLEIGACEKHFEWSDVVIMRHKGLFAYGLFAWGDERPIEKICWALREVDNDHLLRWRRNQRGC